MSHPKESAPTSPLSHDEGRNQLWHWYWLALLLVPLPMVAHYLVWNWQYEQYHFFPLLLIAVLGLAYSRFDGVIGAPRGWMAWIPIVLGLLTVLGSLALDTPWLAAIALVLFASSFLYSISGPNDASLFGLSLPLWLLVRLPLGYDQLLVLRLQSVTTQLTSVVLDVVRVPHAIAGNVIQLADRELFVAEACSGIQSVFTLAFVASLLIAMNRRPLLMFPLYLIVACVLAVAANVLRVSSVAMGQAWLDMDLASGWPHEMVGYTALAIGIGLLLSFDQLLLAMIHPIGDLDDEFAENPILTFWTWVTASRLNESSHLRSVSDAWANSFDGRPVLKRLYWGTSSIAILFLLASTARAVTRSQPTGQTMGMYSAMGPIIEPQADLFHDAFSVMRTTDHLSVRDGENPRLGENADVWTVELAGRQAQLVVSQTYSEWHEFCLCYEIDGWRLLNRETLNTAFGEGDEDTPFVAALFTKEDGRWGQLLHAGIDSNGAIVDPPEMAGRFSNRFNPEDSHAHDVVMLQLWITGNQKLDSSLYADVKSDFKKALEILSRECIEQTLTASPKTAGELPLRSTEGVE